MESSNMNSKLGLGPLIYNYGITAAVIFIGFFFLFKYLGIVQVTEFRALNFVVLFFVVYSEIKSAMKSSENRLDYFTGLGIGFMTSVVSFAIFSLFMFVYLRFIDPAFMEYLIKNAPFGQYLSPLNVSFVITLEGAAGGTIITFILMQYLKKEDAEDENENVLKSSDKRLIEEEA